METKIFANPDPCESSSEDVPDLAGWQLPTISPLRYTVVPKHYTVVIDRSETLDAYSGQHETDSLLKAMIRGTRPLPTPSNKRHLDLSAVVGRRWAEVPIYDSQTDRLFVNTLTKTDGDPRVSTLSEYIEIQRRLLEAFDQAILDSDEDSAAPSDRSLVEAIRVFVDLATKGWLISPFDVSVDHEGALRIEWKNQRRICELVLPSSDSESRYIYHSDEASFGTIDDPDTATLKKWLDWCFTFE